MTKKSCLKKGLVMAGIIAAVLSLAGCPKEAGSSGGGDNEFNIASVEGTWVCSPYNSVGSDESIVITSNSITVTLYNTSTGYNSVRFTGEIVKALKNNSIVGIIGKNSSNKFKVYYLKNINNNNSIEVGLYSVSGTVDSLAAAEEEFNDWTNSSLLMEQLEFHTYSYQ